MSEITNKDVDRMWDGIKGAFLGHDLVTHKSYCLVCSKPVSVPSMIQHVKLFHKDIVKFYIEKGNQNE